MVLFVHLEFLLRIRLQLGGLDIVGTIGIVLGVHVVHVVLVVLVVHEYLGSTVVLVVLGYLGSTVVLVVLAVRVFLIRTAGLEHRRRRLGLVGLGRLDNDCAYTGIVRVAGCRG